MELNIEIKAFAKKAFDAGIRYGRRSGLKREWTYGTSFGKWWKLQLKKEKKKE